MQSYMYKKVQFLRADHLQQEYMHYLKKKTPE